MNPNLGIGHLFSRGWRAFKSQPWLMVGMFLAYSALGSIFNSGGNPDSGVPAWVGLIWLFISGPLTAGLYYAGVQAARGEGARFDTLIAGFHNYHTILGVSLLYYLGTLVGLVLLIVPGVIFAIGFAPALLIAMEHDLSVMDCMRGAWALTKGYKLQIFLLAVVTSLFVMLGMLALFVGVFVTGAISVCIYGAAYDELTKQLD